MGGRISASPQPFPATWAQLEPGVYTEVLAKFKSIPMMSDEEFLSVTPPVPELHASSWSFSEVYVQCAECAVQHDIGLNAFVYRLVPRQVPEEQFWRLFFCHAYRIVADTSTQPAAMTLGEFLEDWHLEDGIAYNEPLEEAEHPVAAKVTPKGFDTEHVAELASTATSAPAQATAQTVPAQKGFVETLKESKKPEDSDRPREAITNDTNCVSSAEIAHSLSCEPESKTALSANKLDNRFGDLASCGSFSESLQKLNSGARAELLDALKVISTMSNEDFLSVTPPLPELEASAWNFNEKYIQFATAIVQHDMALNAFIYRLVPRKISEEEFWRRFFCHSRRIATGVSAEPGKLAISLDPQSDADACSESRKSPHGSKELSPGLASPLEKLPDAPASDLAPRLQPVMQADDKRESENVKEPASKALSPGLTSSPGKAPDAQTSDLAPSLQPAIQAEGSRECENVKEPAKPDNLKHVEPERHETRFGSMRMLFMAAAVRDELGEQQDVSMENFFQACELYRDILSKLGTAVGFVLSDIDDNLGGAKKAYMECPEQRKTIRDFLQPHHPGGHAGIGKMMWLLRGLEFFLVMIENLFESNGSKGAVEAYSETLMQYHGWAIQMTVKVGMRAMPSIDTICRSEGLCLNTTVPERCREVCTREAPPAAKAALERVRFMIDLMKKAGHWSTKKA